MENTRLLQLKEILSDKKSKLTIYVIGVLWIAVVMQIAVNTFFRPNNDLLSAFTNTNSKVSSFELEMAADYGTGFLSESDKKELIYYIANEIGLRVDEGIVINREYDDCEVFVHKASKNADTTIKVVSINKEDEEGISRINHYVIVRLKLYTNPDSILNYRKLLDNVFADIKTSNLQTSMQATSNYVGKLSLNDMNVIADNMVSNLEGKIAYANRDENLFTIYAFTALIPEYITSLGNKINIHVAINYDETTDSTNIYLGTPVINNSY